MRDPYEILGVAKTASEAEIKSAYRKLAKELHPDLNPGKKGIEEKFKEVSAAYSLLSDADKRKRFDAGEIDASGAQQAPRGYYRDFGDGSEAGKYAHQEGFSSDADMEDFLSGLFRGAGRKGAGGPGGDFKMRGSDVSYSLRVGFLDAAKGAEKSLTMPDGRVLKVNIPAGATDRLTLRLAGQGNPGYGEGASPGDAFIEIHIEPHAYFKRKDSDIHVEVPVTLNEAVLGGKIEVPTIDGPVAMSISKGSNSGTVLRLKNKGVLDRSSGQRGHEYVTLKLVLPDAPDPALEAFLAEWKAPENYQPRQKMRP
jgi:DnaJ-class molecular chaperone